MKIYHRKNFYYGIFCIAMGLLLIGTCIWKDSYDLKSIVLSLLMLLFGSSSLLRSLNRSLSRKDKIEARDERNLLVDLRAKRLTMTILRGILLILRIGLALAAAFSPEETQQLIFASMLIVSGLLFTGSYIIELFCALHYENHT